MKTKGRKTICVLVVFIIIAVTALSLCACDDNDNTDKPDYKPLTFEEGTTIEEVLAMFEDGRIENCTVEAIYYFDGEVDLYGVLKANKNIFYRYSESYTVEIIEEEYIIYSAEDAKVYYIDDYNESGVTPSIDYEWYEKALYDDGMGWMNESLDSIFGDDELSNIVIEGSEIRVSDERGETTYRIYDMNATEIIIAEKFSNYKNLAIKKD